MAPGIAWQDTISSKDQRRVATQNSAFLPHAPHIFYWACVGLETLPQFFELGRVGEEGAAAVDDFVGQDGLPAVGAGTSDCGITTTRVRPRFLWSMLMLAMVSKVTLFPPPGRTGFSLSILNFVVHKKATG